MIAISGYILKVVIISGVFCGYYFFTLRDKIFHKWNRFYLLLTVTLSLLLPFVSINISPSSPEKVHAIKMLQVISGQEVVISGGQSHTPLLTGPFMVVAGYAFVSLFITWVLWRSLLKIWRIRKRFPHTKVQGITFINSDAEGTPFSFFQTIFWNNAIDLHTLQGQQIFNHEIAHIKGKHSHDKVFINLILLFFWINPFYWIIRKELNMIHEFVADKMAVENGDLTTLAEMILLSVYPKESFSFTNKFFSSSIKRRLRMLPKNHQSKVNYFSRVMALPLAALLFTAFALKLQNTDTGPVYEGRQVTVVIDAGHGGMDAGAMEGALSEKNLTLAIARKVKELNKNKNIEILLTRTQDIAMSLQDRMQMVTDQKADAFISIHLDGALGKIPEAQGVTILIPKEENAHLLKSRLLGSAMLKAFEGAFPLPLASALMQPERNIYLLSSNQSPAIFINPGSMSSPVDLEFIASPENQALTASNILKGIEIFAGNVMTLPINSSIDTVPLKKIIKYRVLNNSGKVIVTYSDNTTETLTWKQAEQKGMAIPPPPPPPSSPVSLPPAPPPPPAPLVVSSYKGKNFKYLPVKISGGKVLLQYSDGSEETITIQEAKKAGLSVKEVKFTPPRVKKDKDGLPHAASKRKDEHTSHQTNKSQSDWIFIKVQREASFPGGVNKWVQHIQQAIFENIDDFDDNDYGTCIVKFIVDENGKVSNVEATTMKGTNLAATAVKAVEKGPDWIPAKFNNRPVKAYRLQPVTLKNPTNQVEMESQQHF